MNKKERFELIRKQAEAGLLNPAEQFEAEARLACATEREISSDVITRYPGSFENIIRKNSFPRNSSYFILDYDGYYNIVDIPSWKCVQKIKKYGSSTISPDGKYILSTGTYILKKENLYGYATKIKIVELRSGKVILNFEDFESEMIYKSEVTSDNKNIIILNIIKVFDKKSTQVSVYDFKIGNLCYRIGEKVEDFVLSPDGQQLYYSEYDKIYKVDLKSRNVEIFYQSNEMLDELQISKDGMIIVALEGPKKHGWSNTNHFRIFDLKNKNSKTLKSDKHHKKFCLHPSGKYLFSYDVDFKYLHGNMEWHHAWDLSTGKIKDLGDNLKNIRYPIIFTPDGKYLIKTYKWKIEFWDLEKKEKCGLIDFTQKRTEHRTAFFTNKNKIIVWGEIDHWHEKKSLDQIDLLDGTLKKKIFEFNNKKIENETIDKEGNFIAFKLKDKKTLEVWDIQKNEMIFTWFLNFSSNTMSFLEINNEKVIAYSDGLKIYIRRIDDGELLQTFETKRSPRAIYLSKDKRTLLSRGYIYNTWFDLKLGLPIFNYKIPREVAFSTSQKKGTIVSGQLLGHINEIYIDLEKIRLYVADTFTFEYNLDKVERQIYLFDLKKDQLLKKFTGYEADVASLLVCHDSQTFISIHQDGEIRKWDIKTEKCIKIFTNPKKIAFTGGVVSVQISEDNKKLIIVGSKGEIYFWDYQTGELLVKNYNLTNGYLWITPPDDFAPNGWLHTNRPELVSLIEMDKADQGNPTYILEDDQRFQEYMQMYNDQEMVMMRLNDFDRYQELLEIRLGNQKRTTEMLLKEHNPIKLLIKATPIQNDKVDGYE